VVAKQYVDQALGMSLPLLRSALKIVLPFFFLPPQIERNVNCVADDLVRFACKCLACFRRSAGKSGPGPDRIRK
jgi:hypothetical protein